MGKRSRFKKVKAVGADSVFSQAKNQKLDVVNMKQRVPKKFTELMEMKELCKGGNERQIRRRLKEKMGGMDDTEKQRRDEAKKKPGESHYRYIERLKSALDVSRRQARTTEQEFPEKKTDKNQKIPAKKTKMKERLNKMKEKRKKQRESRKQDEKEKERWTDRVEFGEVAMRPPTLTSKPRKAGEMKKPGQKDFLFLKSGLGNSKKSNLSMARTKELSDERNRVIQAYRDLKKSKMTSS